MESVSLRLADAMARASFDDLPPRVIADTQRSVLDWLGSALAGSVEPPARMVQQVVRGFGTCDEATVFGSGHSSAAGAALANGVASHILEFDDVHKGSTLHPAAPIIPAALAVAEREHADGRAFLLAVAVGYEAALRIGEAVGINHYRFWHPTGTAATFGAAMASGSLLRLDSRRMLDALGSAGTQAAGLWEFNADGAMSKHLHPGKAAFNGILAADLAKTGFTGASRILEGERGFFRATSVDSDPTRITSGLGAHWKISENCYKLHSCCGHTHTAIDAAIGLRTRLTQVDRTIDAVKECQVETYGPGFEIVKETNPRTPFQAKFSLAYVTAAALLEGRVGLEQFSPDRFSDAGVIEARIASLLPRIHAKVTEDLTAMYPAAWPARIHIILKDGSELSGGVDYPRGNPENPVSTEELEDKFRLLIVPRFGRDTAERGLKTVRELPDAKDMAMAFSDLGES
jgi:2-methylcitrate dehydratase PrpD